MRFGDYLTTDQVSEIISRIEHGCKMAADIEQAIRTYSYAPYMENRKHHQTGMILSSFPPDPDAPINGLTITKLSYGKGNFKYNQPLISNKSILLQIYKQGNTLDSKIVSDTCDLIKKTGQTYGCIMVSTDESCRLISISVQFMNVDGSKGIKEEIKRYPRIVKRAA